MVALARAGRLACALAAVILVTAPVFVPHSAGATAGVNDYPYANSTPDGGPDPWGYPYRECTSFAAWRINHDLGVAFTWHYHGASFRDASTWAAAATHAGVPVDHNPSSGSIAVFQPGVDGALSTGHVAFVLSSTASSITVEDYNYHKFAYWKHTLALAPSPGLQFIHFRSTGIGGSWRQLLFRTGQIGFALNADNRQQVFATAATGALMTRYQTAINSTSWNSGFASLGGSWRRHQQVATAVNADGRIEVFMVGLDGQLYTRYQTAPNGGFNSSWRSMGGSWPGNDVPTVGYNADGRIEVFVIGNDHQLYTKYQTAPNGSFNSSWLSMGGSWPSSDIPATGVNADGRIQLYLVGNDHQLYTKYQTAPNGGFNSSWLSMGGSWLGNPAVGLNADGRQQVYLIGTNSQLYTKYQTANNAGFNSTWVALGGTFRPSDAPSVGVNADGRQELYVVGTNAHLYSRYQVAPNSSSWNSTWVDFGGSWPGDPAVGVNANGRQQVFLIGNDGRMYTRYQIANNGGWNASWVSFGGSF
jgi:surface antigen